MLVPRRCAGTDDQGQAGHVQAAALQLPLGRSTGTEEQSWEELQLHSGGTRRGGDAGGSHAGRWECAATPALGIEAKGRMKRQ